MSPEMNWNSTLLPKIVMTHSSVWFRLSPKRSRILWAIEIWKTDENKRNWCKQDWYENESGFIVGGCLGTKRAVGIRLDKLTLRHLRIIATIFKFETPKITFTCFLNLFKPCSHMFTILFGDISVIFHLLALIWKKLFAPNKTPKFLFIFYPLNWPTGTFCKLA